MPSGDRRVIAWWACLSALAVINIAIFATVVATGERPLADAQVVLSGLYVFGCAYRCFLPVYDIPRIGIVDSWASSVLVGRTVATIAELAFAAQWAVYLYGSELPAVRLASLLIVPIIVVAPGKGPYTFPPGYETPWDRIEIMVTAKMSPNLFVLHGSSFPVNRE